MCAKEVVLASQTTTNPEAPEMLKLPPDAWIGFIQGDFGPEMIVTCSNKCTDDLLSH